jgi:pimeloyl-ACP methyl ester carboxylesterase
MIGIVTAPEPAMSPREQIIKVDGHAVWTRRVGGTGDSGRLPVVILHGGPGVPSDYLEPLELLARSGREGIRYDQLGCGRSDHPDVPALKRALEELEYFSREVKILGVYPAHPFRESFKEG